MVFVRSSRGENKSYKEFESESEKSDYSEDETVEAQPKEDENCQTIEKIIDMRIGEFFYQCIDLSWSDYRENP